MRPEDLTYYQRRAQQEIALAQAAEHPRAVRAHYLLASIYLDWLHGNSALPTAVEA